METIHWKKLITGKYSVAEVVDFFRAELRYFIYYKYYDLDWLMQDHIREQIDFRIDIMMDRKCYNDGQCKVCGCTTPDLQFTNASCKGHCYPCIVDKKTWKQFKDAGVIKERYGNEFYIWTNIMHVTKFYKSTKKFITVKHYVG